MINACQVMFFFLLQPFIEVLHVISHLTKYKIKLEVSKWMLITCIFMFKFSLAAHFGGSVCRFWVWAWIVSGREFGVNHLPNLLCWFIHGWQEQPKEKQPKSMLLLCNVHLTNLSFIVPSIMQYLFAYIPSNKTIIILYNDLNEVICDHLLYNFHRI